MASMTSVGSFVSLEEVASTLASVLTSYVYWRPGPGKEAALQYVVALTARFFTSALSGGVFDQITLGLFNEAVKRELVVYAARYGLATFMHESSPMLRAWNAVFSDALGLHISGSVANVWARVAPGSATGPVSGANANPSPSPAPTRNPPFG